jgi:hypothetical protein
MKHVMGTTVAITGLFIFCGIVRGSDDIFEKRMEESADKLVDETTWGSRIAALEQQHTQHNQIIINQQQQIVTLKQETDTKITHQAAQIQVLEKENAKFKNFEHYYARNERAWECSLGLTTVMAAKAYTPPIIYTAGAKVASLMPAALTKYSASAISFGSPYVLPAIGVAAALWLLKNIGTDMRKNWALDRKKFMEEKNVKENTNLSRKLSCQLLWHRFVKHTSKNVETILAPAVVFVTALRYLRR